MKTQLPPALLTIVPIILGIIIGKYIQVGLVCLYIIILLLFFFLTIAYRFNKYIIFFMLVQLALVALGWVRMEQSHQFPQTHVGYIAFPEEPVAIEGTVCGPVVYAEEKTTFSIKSDSIWIDYTVSACSGNIKVTIYNMDKPLKYGDHIVCKGNLRAPPGLRNPGGFDYRSYLAANGIHAIMSMESDVMLQVLAENKGTWLLQRGVYPVRRFVLDIVSKSLNGQPAALLKGLLVGAREDIHTELYNAFANVGVIHVLAVSGLHVGFILIGLNFIFKTLGLGPIYKGVLTLAGLYFFVLLTGSHPPVVRAAIMAGTYTLGKMLHRRATAVNTLSIAILIILLLNPLDLFQVGFQLSCTAVLGIVLLYRAFAQWLNLVFTRLYEQDRRILINIIQLFLVSLAAQLATLPLTAWYFGRVPVVSLLLNLLIVPLTMVVVSAGFAGAIIAALFQPLGVLIIWLDGWLLKVMILVVEWSSALPFAGLQTARPSFLWILIYFTMLASVLAAAYNRKQAFKGLVFVFLILIAINAWKPIFQKEKLRVTFFDVGQGDAALFEYPDGSNMLIDCGERSEHFDCGEQVIAPYLLQNGIQTLDVLVVTHTHSDHCGGAPFLIRNFDVKRLVLPATSDTINALKIQLDSLARSLTVERTNPFAGDIIECGKYGKAMVLHPDSGMINHVNEHPAELNNASLVMLVPWGQFKFFLTGDAEKESESRFLQYGDLLNCDVLKVGHHGSDTATGKALLDKTSPQYAVVSVGHRNRFGLPSDSLMQEIVDRGTQVLRTDRDGAIVFETDGELIERICWKGFRLHL